MSGFEIAGVVLGALPILFKAVDFSKDGFSRVGLAFHKRKNVQKLANALLLQQGILEAIVKSILHESGCEDIWRLEQDPYNYLTDKSVQEEVLDFLGAKNDAAFTGALEQCLEIVKKIAKNITGLVPTYKGAPDDLLAVMNANRDADGKVLDLIPRIKLAFNMKDIKEAATELDATTAALDRLTTRLLSNHRVVDDKTSKKAVKLAKALRHVRTFASDLSLAIFHGWGAGCHRKHETRLFLEDRVDNAAEILKRIEKESATPILTFHLIFAADVDQQHKVWHESTVQVFNGISKPNDRPSLISQDSGKSQVTFTTPEAASPLVKPEITTISDICIAITNANINKQQIVFADQKLGTVCTNETIGIKIQCVETMTLRDIFSVTNAPRRGPILPWKFRMLLALRLASNLLQLFQTKWLPNTWSKDMVYFQLQPGSNVTNLLLDLGRPFVSLSLDPSSAESTPVEGLKPKIALLELGILLLELWHEVTLESRCDVNEAPKGYYQRLMLAVEWLEDTHDLLPDLYYRAVFHCIQRPCEEARSANWEDMKFWGAICCEVIEPLSKNCGQWRPQRHGASNAS